MTIQETQSFFDDYREAFNRLDGHAVADMWHCSSGIADSHTQNQCGRLTWWPADAPMRANHVALCDLYRRSGYAQANFEIKQHVPMGPNHAYALLSWQLFRKDGSLLQAFHTGYNLMRTQDGPKVLLAVAYQEDIAEMTSHAAA